MQQSSLRMKALELGLDTHALVGKVANAELLRRMYDVSFPAPTKKATKPKKGRGEEGCTKQPSKYSKEWFKIHGPEHGHANPFKAAKQ